MIPYVIRAGDHVAKLAVRMGFDAKAVWRDPANDALRALRSSPDLLAPGDILHVPPAARRRPLELRAGSQNRFRVEVPSVKLRIRLGRPPNAFSNEPFRVELPGAGDAPPIAEGVSDGDAFVAFEAPADVDTVRLVLTGQDVTYDVRIGHLDPPEMASGLRDRLRQLGYAVGTARELEAALRAFQGYHRLEVTGVTNAATRDALVRAHGV